MAIIPALKRQGQGDVLWLRHTSTYTTLTGNRTLIVRRPTTPHPP